MAHLIVTIDTEEEGLWGGRYLRTGNTVENIRGVPRFQKLCDRFGIQPVYLVDAPVVESDDAVGILRAIHDDGRCEIGAHVHPWCNPPFEEDINEYNTYLCNLPESLQRRKTEWLTNRIESRFGRRPTSFRAGRYGLDATGARILSDLGYMVDSSVIPFTDYSPMGPDFHRAPFRPYRVSKHNLCADDPSGDLLEVPVCVGYSRANFSQANAIRTFAKNSWLRRFRAVGIIDRLGIARRIKLCPEQATAKNMQRLISACLRQHVECVVMMLHSSSLMAGCSPYVADGEDALEGLYDRLAQTFDFCVGSKEMTPTTLTGFACLKDKQSDISVRDSKTIAGCLLK